MIYRLRKPRQNTLVQEIVLTGLLAILQVATQTLLNGIPLILFAENGNS